MSDDTKPENYFTSSEGLERSADNFKTIAKFSGIGAAAIFGSVAVAKGVLTHTKQPLSPMANRVMTGAEIIGGFYLALTVLSVALAVFLRHKAKQAATITPPGP